MPSQSLEGSEATSFIQKNLVKVSADPVRWQTTYEDPQSGQFWILDYPNGSYHGGGSPRLRTLPLDRSDILEVLLRNLHLNLTECQQLAPSYALESELAAIIEAHLRRHSWYPAERRPWPVNGVVYEGHILQLADPHTIYLWNQRDTPIASGTIVNQTQTTFSSIRDAIQAFIQREWPTHQIDGIPIQRG